MRLALKLVPLAVLGCAAALLVACGDRNGLLSGSDAQRLQEALAAAQSACASGQPADAELAAQRFSDRVAALPAGSVDPRLIANLQEGAQTLSGLVADTCTTTAETTTAPTTVTTTTVPPPTTETTTTPTDPTTPTGPTTPPEPPTTPAPTTPPDDDGDDDADTGGGSPGNSGNGPPGPEGNPGGAGFPGEDD